MPDYTWIKGLLTCASCPDLFTFKSLGFNCLMPFAFRPLENTGRIAESGIPFIPHIDASWYEPTWPSIMAYYICDEPVQHGMSEDDFLAKLAWGRARTNKPITAIFAAYSVYHNQWDYYRVWPYLDFICIDTYFFPDHAQAAIDLATSYGKPSIGIGQGFESVGLGIPRPNIAYIDNWWRSRGCPVIWFGWNVCTTSIGSRPNDVWYNVEIRKLYGGFVNLSGSLSLAGTVLRKEIVGEKFYKLIQSSLTFSSSLSKALIQSLSGNLSFTGAFPSKSYNALQGLTYSQLQNYIYRDLFSKRLFLKVKPQILSGILNFVGGLSTKWWLLKKKVCSSGLTFSSALSQKVKCSLTGVSSYTSSLSILAKNRIYGSLSAVGLLYFFSMGLILSLKTYTELQDLTYSELQAFTYGYSYKVLLGGLFSFSSTLSQKTSLNLSGVFSSSGNLIMEAKSILSGVLSLPGALINKVKTRLSGGLTYSGLAKRNVKIITSGVLTFSGRLLKTGYASFIDLLKKLIQLVQSKGF